jgi:hypothetical protein
VKLSRRFFEEGQELRLATVRALPGRLSGVSVPAVNPFCMEQLLLYGRAGRLTDFRHGQYPTIEAPKARARRDTRSRMLVVASVEDSVRE